MLTAAPPDPLRFLAAEAQRLHAREAGGLSPAPPPFFTAPELRALFRLHDVQGCGVVGAPQLQAALAALGVGAGAGAGAGGAGAGAGAAAAAYDADAFVAAVEAALAASVATGC